MQLLLRKKKKKSPGVFFRTLVDISETKAASLVFHNFSVHLFRNKVFLLITVSFSQLKKGFHFSTHPHYPTHRSNKHSNKQYRTKNKPPRRKAQNFCMERKCAVFKFSILHVRGKRDWVDFRSLSFHGILKSLI